MHPAISSAKDVTGNTTNNPTEINLAKETKDTRDFLMGEDEDTRYFSKWIMEQATRHDTLQMFSRKTAWQIP